MTDTAAPVAHKMLRKYTEAQRTQIVAESFETGNSVIAVARRHGVRPNLLSYWRKLSRTTGRTTKLPATAATLAQVQVTAAASPATPPTTDGVIEIDLEQRCIRVRSMVDGAMLREVLAAVR